MQALLVDGILGLSIGLVAITAAQAALPDSASLLGQPKPVAIHLAALPAALIAFIPPVDGATIDSPFGLRQLPWEGAGRLHAGVDLLAEKGEAVVAAADGVVTEIAQDGGLGRYVEIVHAEGLTTRYAHMARFADIAVGTAVKAGTAIGFVGSTGSSTGAHLHFEIRDAKERPMNPESFIGRSFATAEDLPLKEALRPAHRGVRVAYVSNIPASKRALMQARLDAVAARKIESSLLTAAPAEAVSDVAGANPDGRPAIRVNGATSSVGQAGPLPIG